MSSLSCWALGDPWEVTAGRECWVSLHTWPVCSETPKNPPPTRTPNALKEKGKKWFGKPFLLSPIQASQNTISGANPLLKIKQNQNPTSSNWLRKRSFPDFLPLLCSASKGLTIVVATLLWVPTPEGVGPGTPVAWTPEARTSPRARRAEEGHMLTLL